METFFAPAQRTSSQELTARIQMVNSSPVMSGLLETVSGLLAVLDENRQILAINDAFMKMLGIKNIDEVLGIRPGEALQCAYAHDEPAGCGTTKFCSSCGAAIAIVVSLTEDKSVERLCALHAQRGTKMVDIVFSVRSQPVKMNGDKVLLLFLQDITYQHQRAALERTFFHDINNMMSGLLGASEMLMMENADLSLAQIIHQSSVRLKHEIDIQRSLIENELTNYQPLWQIVEISQVIDELKTFFVNHPLTDSRRILYQPVAFNLYLKTDLSLLLRILCNMVVNALEAAPRKSNVKIWVELSEAGISFCVWNGQQIPDNVKLRIFQRNFSTKDGAGRGIGTFSMKLFGEKILGGKVTFTTSNEGTVFRITLPVD